MFTEQTTEYLYILDKYLEYELSKDKLLVVKIKVVSAQRDYGTSIVRGANPEPKRLI